MTVAVILVGRDGDASLPSANHPDVTGAWLGRAPVAGATLWVAPRAGRGLPWVVHVAHAATGGGEAPDVYVVLHGVDPAVAPTLTDALDDPEVGAATLAAGPTSALSAHAFAVRAAAVDEIGGLIDPAAPTLEAAVLDLSYRLHAAGWRVAPVPGPRGSDPSTDIRRASLDFLWGKHGWDWAERFEDAAAAVDAADGSFLRARRAFVDAFSPQELIDRLAPGGTPVPTPTPSAEPALPLQTVAPASAAPGEVVDLQHLDPRAAAARLRALHTAADGGELAVELPDIAASLRLVGQLVDDTGTDLGWAGVYGSGRHRSGYTATSLADELRDAGFERIRRVPVQRPGPAVGTGRDMRLVANATGTPRPPKPATPIPAGDLPSLTAAAPNTRKRLDLRHLYALEPADAAAALRRAREVLEDGGELTVEAATHEACLERLDAGDDAGVQQALFGVPGQRWIGCGPQLRRLISDAGFDITSSRSHGAGLRITATATATAVPPHPIPAPRTGTWPLDTSAPVRILAWPRYDNDDADAVFRVFGRVLAARTDVCLCLRVDPDLDPGVEDVVRVLEAAHAKNLDPSLDVQILLIDGPMGPSEWARLGRSVLWCLGVPSIGEPSRTALYESVGAPVIPTGEALAANLDKFAALAHRARSH